MRETSYLKNNEKVLRILRELDSFSPFSTQDIMSFLDIGKLMEYDKNEEIISEGHVDNFVYFLLSGEIQIIKDGKIIKSLRRSGELFGEMGLIDGSPRSASVKAASKALVLRVDGTIVEKDIDLQDMARGYAIYRMFCMVLAERLRVTTEENAALKKKLEEAAA